MNVPKPFPSSSIASSFSCFPTRPLMSYSLKISCGSFINLLEKGLRKFAFGMKEIELKAIKKLLLCFFLWRLVFSALFACSQIRKYYSLRASPSGAVPDRLSSFSMEISNCFQVQVQKTVSFLQTWRHLKPCFFSLPSPSFPPIKKPCSSRCIGNCFGSFSDFSGHEKVKAWEVFICCGLKPCLIFG